MDLRIDEEFNEICIHIKNLNKSIEEWMLIESDDRFQMESYVGGFDATEMEFCFSYYDQNRKEYWFQISLNEIDKVIKREKIKLKLIEII